MNKLSKRAIQAVEILKNGGFWTHRLERDNWKGREQFKHRLWHGYNSAASGFGGKTFFELHNAGLLQVTNKCGTSRYETTYSLKS